MWINAILKITKTVKALLRGVSWSQGISAPISFGIRAKLSPQVCGGSQEQTNDLCKSSLGSQSHAGFGSASSQTWLELWLRNIKKCLGHGALQFHQTLMICGVCLVVDTTNHGIIPYSGRGPRIWVPHSVQGLLMSPTGGQSGLSYLITKIKVDFPWCFTRHLFLNQFGFINILWDHIPVHHFS